MQQCTVSDQWDTYKKIGVCETFVDKGQPVTHIT